MRNEALIDQFNAEGIDRTEKTRDWYAARLKQYLEWLDCPISQTGPAHVKRFLGMLRERQYSWSTRNGAHTALNVFYRWLVNRGHIDANPFEVEEIRRPRKPRRIRTLPSLAEVQAVIDTMLSTDNPHASRDLALLLLMLDGGLRREEVISLDYNNVDLFTGRIAVLAAKGDNQRWSYIESPTIAAIINWLAHHPGGGSGPLFVALFGKNSGQRLNPRTVNRALREWSGRAGLKDHLRPHDLRRLFATYFDQSGGGTRILQGILGHENLETTERYIIHQDDEIRRQHRRHSPINRLNF